MAKWRRFLPRRRQANMATLQAPVEELSIRTLRSLQDANEYSEYLKRQTSLIEVGQLQQHYYSLLLAQAPRAAAAQHTMDTHKYGYHNRQKRLYELIDFNDTFVDLILATPVRDRAGLAAKLYQDITALCRRLDTKEFTDTQFAAIANGLGREIAVYTAAEEFGYEVRMASRTQDAFGIDMMIAEAGTNSRLYVDCKAPSAFRHRLEDLVKYGKITEAQLLKADEQDFLTMDRRFGDESIPVTLLCIRTETVGEVHDFVFDNPRKFRTLLQQAFTSVKGRETLDIFAKKW